MSAHAAAGRHYTLGVGVPPFFHDRRIRCGPDAAELFFLDSRTDEAKALCRACPLRDACLRWAIDAGISNGVWGGMTVEERNAWARGEAFLRVPTPAGRPSCCGNGHELTDDNVYYAPSRPNVWRCRQCGREQVARAKARRRSVREQGAAA